MTLVDHCVNRVCLNEGSPIPPTPSSRQTLGRVIIYMRNDIEKLEEAGSSSLTEKLKLNLTTVGEDVVSIRFNDDAETMKTIVDMLAKAKLNTDEYHLKENLELNSGWKKMFKYLKIHVAS